MCDIANKMKLRQHYTFEQLLEMNRDYEAIDLQKILDEMAYIGILEYDYGDNYDHTHELKDRPRIRRYRLPFYVPGSAELFNSSVDRIAKNPAVASFFERMTFIPSRASLRWCRPEATESECMSSRSRKLSTPRASR